MVDIRSRTRPVALRQHQGLTVIELMVVVAVLGILAALAAPSFTAVIQYWRIRQVSDELAFSFASARSEAIRRGGGIVVRRIHPNDTDCPGLVSASGTEWGCGWFVFADTDGDGERGENEPVIRTSAPARRLRVERTAAASFFRLNQWGETTGLGVLSFIVKPREGETGATAAVCINTGGRVAIRRGAGRCQS